jgi:regulator of sigma E protease
MDVEEFCILGLPFGKKVVLWRAKDGMPLTMHPFAPLGGFVRIRGMEPKADGSETKVERGFYAQGLGSRALVLFAGPLFSILFGFIFFLGAFVVFGDTEARKDTVVGFLEPKGPAESAGLMVNDRVIEVGGKPVDKFFEMRRLIAASAGKELTLKVRRGSDTLEFRVVPKAREMAVFGQDSKPLKAADGSILRAEQGYIGVGPVTYQVPIPILDAVTKSSAICWQIIVETGKVLLQPSQLKENAGGVISIARETSKATDEGVLYFLRLAGLVSVSLGLINLLPIPLMDGGQMVVVLIEALRGGRRLSIRTQEVIGFVGLVLIGLMFIGATYLDIGRLLKN